MRTLCPSREMEETKGHTDLFPNRRIEVTAALRESAQ